MEVLDAENFAEYVEKTPGIVADFGGQYLVNDGESEQIEGKGPDRHVVIRFKDMPAGHRFYNSTAFQAVLPLAKAYTRRDLVFVEGFE